MVLVTMMNQRDTTNDGSGLFAITELTNTVIK